MAKDGWIGVDLDGTLAVDLPGRFEPGLIGPPVPLMLSRVQRWLAAGRDVRIMTARVSHDGTNERRYQAQQARHAIEQWCMSYLGRVIPITNEKDYMMEQLWDDRAVQVLHNSGIRADGRME